MILESKENEIKELQNKLQLITKEDESRKDQLKSAESESVASDSLLEEEDDDYCEIIEEFCLPNDETRDPKRTTERRKVFKNQMKSIIQVN